jgi:multimeric flavodoxin WrbA
MVKVKILGIAASPRHGNTEIMVKEALRGAQELADVEADFLTLAGRKISPCDADYKCFHEKNPKKPCVSITDDLDEVFLKMMEADGIIIGTPTYWAGVTAQLKMLIDRSMALEACDYALRNKVGGALTCAVGRNLGLETCLVDIHNWFIQQDMIVVSVGPERVGGSAAGATAIQVVGNVDMKLGRTPKEALSAVLKDEGGMKTCRNLGRRVTEVAKAIKTGFSQLPENEHYYPYKGYKLEYEEVYGMKKQ